MNREEYMYCTVPRGFSTFRLFFSLTNCTKYLPDFQPDYMQNFWDFFPSFLSTIFKLTRRNPVSRPDKTGFKFGNKGYAIVRIWEKRMCVLLSVSYRNVSAALSRLNKVHNSIYSKKYALRVNFVNLNSILYKQEKLWMRCSIYSNNSFSLPKICTICWWYLIWDLYAFLFDQMVLLRTWKVIWFVLDRRLSFSGLVRFLPWGNMYWKKPV
jgi:hypothetical protein